jgi:thiol-disulfide isomerase/thioredoxin
VNLRTLAVLLIVPTLAHSQTPQPNAPTAEDLLKQVAAAYAHPGNFHIEVIEESVTTNELERLWSRTYRTAIRGTGNRFRIEIRSPYASWIQVSDGTTESSYWVEAKRHTRHPLTDTKPSQHYMISGVNSEVSNAWNTITFLEPLAADSIHATRLADETISLNGHTFPCYVVHAESNSQGQTEISSDRTFWIDKQTRVFRKIVTHDLTYMTNADVHIPLHSDVTRTFPVFDLDTVSPDSVFLFTPPDGVELVDRMAPDSIRNMQPASITPHPPFQPHPAPDIQITDSDGKTTPLSAFRGHPVLIDLWATWCGPCLVSMPSFAKLADTYRSSGLTVLSIDEDNERQGPLAYLKRHNFAWTNYHDKEDKLLNAFKGTGIPLVVLIDKDGIIVFEDNTGDYEQALHAALAKMFPSAVSPTDRSRR